MFTHQLLKTVKELKKENEELRWQLSLAQKNMIKPLFANSSLYEQDMKDQGIDFEEHVIINNDPSRSWISVIHYADKFRVRLYAGTIDDLLSRNGVYINEYESDEFDCDTTYNTVFRMQDVLFLLG